MSKIITKFENSSNCINDWLEVGDTINGKKITEIWSSSVGTPVFVVDGIHYCWKDLFKILPEGRTIATTEYVTQEEFNMSEEEFNMSEEKYKTVTSGL